MRDFCSPNLNLPKPETLPNVFLFDERFICLNQFGEKLMENDLTYFGRDNFCLQSVLSDDLTYRDLITRELVLTNLL